MIEGSGETVGIKEGIAGIFMDIRTTGLKLYDKELREILSDIQNDCPKV